MSGHESQGLPAALSETPISQHRLNAMAQPESGHQPYPRSAAQNRGSSSETTLPEGALGVLRHRQIRNGKRKATDAPTDSDSSDSRRTRTRSSPSLSGDEQEEVTRNLLLPQAGPALPLQAIPPHISPPWIHPNELEGTNLHFHAVPGGWVEETVPASGPSHHQAESTSIPIQPRSSQVDFLPSLNGLHRMPEFDEPMDTDDQRESGLPEHSSADATVAGAGSATMAGSSETLPTDHAAMQRLNDTLLQMYGNQAGDINRLDMLQRDVQQLKQALQRQPGVIGAAVLNGVSQMLLSRDAMSNDSADDADADADAEESDSDSDSAHRRKKSKAKRGSAARKKRAQDGDVFGGEGESSGNEESEGFQDKGKQRQKPDKEFNRITKLLLAELGYDHAGVSKKKRTWKHGCDVAAVDAYNTNPRNTIRPTIESPINWTQDLRGKRTWNEEIVCLLTDSVQQSLADDETIVDSYPDSRVRKRVATLLQAMKGAEKLLVEKEAAIASQNAASLTFLEVTALEKQTDSTRYARRHTIWKGRAKFGKDHTVGRTRESMLSTLSLLGPDGMSGNESDGVGDGVQRCQTYWLNSHFSGYWGKVQAEMDANTRLVQGGHPQGTRPRKRGNTARTMHQGLRPSQCGPKEGLPRNWYNPQWFQSLSSAERHMLNTRDARPLPTFDLAEVNVVHANVH